MKKILFLSVLAIIILSFSKKKEITWVAIGDSIIYLNDHPNETGNRVTSGYMTRVTAALPNIHFTNQGHNGWTATRMADSIEKLRLVKADVYSVFLGTNDWWHSNKVGNFADYQTIPAAAPSMVLSELSSIRSAVLIQMQRSF